MAAEADPGNRIRDTELSVQTARRECIERSAPVRDAGPEPQPKKKS